MLTRSRRVGIASQKVQETHANKRCFRFKYNRHREVSPISRRFDEVFRWTFDSVATLPSCALSEVDSFISDTIFGFFGRALEHSLGKKSLKSLAILVAQLIPAAPTPTVSYTFMAIRAIAYDTKYRFTEKTQNTMRTYKHQRPSVL